MELDLESLVVIGALLVAAIVATLLIGRVTRRVERGIEEREGAVSVKRAKTLTSVLRVSAVIAVWVVLSLTALAEAGVQVGPLLAAAGLGGIVLGLGAQSLVSDLIAGFFIVAERQYDVGDVVELQPASGGPVTGEVESIALRTTTLRALDATRHVVPNGQIVVSSNQTRDRSRYMVDLPIAYEADPDAAAEIARRVGEQMRIEPRYREAITGPVEVLGVDAFADSAVVVRAYLQTAPGRQWEVGREFRRRVLRELAEAGIEIPFPQRTVIVKTPAGAGD